MFATFLFNLIFLRVLTQFKTSLMPRGGGKGPKTTRVRPFPGQTRGQPLPSPYPFPGLPWNPPPPSPYPTAYPTYPKTPKYPGNRSVQPQPQGSGPLTGALYRLNVPHLTTQPPTV